MTIESVIEKCKALKLKVFAENLEQTIAIGEQKNWTTLQTIDHLFGLELEQRRKNKIQRAPTTAPFITIFAGLLQHRNDEVRKSMQVVKF